MAKRHPVLALIAYHPNIRAASGSLRAEMLFSVNPLNLTRIAPA